MGKEKKKRSLVKKLTDQYRLIIIDEDTFEHKVDFNLSRLNVFVALGVLSLFLITVTIFIIASTPLREYIPGYPSADFKTKIYRLNNQLDSLQKEIEIRNSYLNNLRMVLTGEIKPGEIQTTPAESDIDVKIDTAALQPSPADLALRKEVEEKEKFSVDNRFAANATRFIPPLHGMISQAFDLKKRHYGTDVVVKVKTPVKSIADGTVVFSDWTPDDGKVIIVQHPGNWLSVYKHNQKLLKRKGEHVKAGEVIAVSGDVGTKSTGPHLHFEMWKNGEPVNPENYIDFSDKY
jgi:murein DD-endopeptidase MepM/ murein hydrolase activator NlpD